MTQKYVFLNALYPFDYLYVFILKQVGQMTHEQDLYAHNPQSGLTFHLDISRLMKKYSICTLFGENSSMYLIPPILYRPMFIQTFIPC